ncbi:hypothetical protein EYF80_052563 [Liparis tanakae]|uniref:Uncharacterized protein n=1 Tax=Liparis tanakae TaxID=230148 RepID=A0A4Z2F902_9TELE|nr:hypothetical protein EYF80_052563 [Liparis tanakae]
MAWGTSTLAEEAEPPAGSAADPPTLRLEPGPQPPDALAGDGMLLMSHSCSSGQKEAFTSLASPSSAEKRAVKPINPASRLFKPPDHCSRNGAIPEFSKRTGGPLAFSFKGVLERRSSVGIEVFIKDCCRPAVGAASWLWPPLAFDQSRSLVTDPSASTHHSISFIIISTATRSGLGIEIIPEPHTGRRSLDVSIRISATETCGTLHPRQ